MCSWTQQLDGVLTSDSDGTLTMWQLQPLAEDRGPLSAAHAALHAAWSVHTPIPQGLVCAGVSVYAPSASAAGSAAEPRDGGDGGRCASVWWPQLGEQRQRHYAAGMPAVGQEKLRHPAPVIGAPRTGTLGPLGAAPPSPAPGKQ